MSDELIFEELPPKGNASSSWVAALVARPGEWARVPLTNSKNAAYYQGKYRVELAGRSVDGEKRVYGRYVGEKGT